MYTTEIRMDLASAAILLQKITKQMAELKPHTASDVEEVDFLNDVVEDIYGDHFTDAIEKLKGDYDPTPWCAVCGAKTQKGCGCDR